MAGKWWAPGTANRQRGSLPPSPWLSVTDTGQAPELLPARGQTKGVMFSVTKSCKGDGGGGLADEEGEGQACQRWEGQERIKDLVIEGVLRGHKTKSLIGHVRSSTWVLLTFILLSFPPSEENKEWQRKTRIDHTGHPNSLYLILRLTSAEVHRRPQMDPGYDGMMVVAQAQPGVIPLFLPQSCVLLVVTCTSIQHSFQNSNTACTHSKDWAGLSSYNNMAMAVFQPCTVMNGTEKPQAHFRSHPSRTGVQRSIMVVGSCSHTDLMSPFCCGDVCQKLQPGALGISEEGKGGMWGEGRKESAETEVSVEPFPIAL